MGRVSAHWRRAPFVLRRHGSILLAVLAAALLVGLTASAAPFLSTAAGSAALKNRLNELSPLTTGVEIERSAGVTPSQPGNAVAARLDRAVGALARQVGSLGTPLATLELDQTPATRPDGSGFAELSLMSRTGVLRHVTVLGHARGPGIWIADTTARALRVHPGGTILLTGTSRTSRPRTARVRVKGIYRALAYERERPYWSNFNDAIYPQNPDAPVPTPFAFTSRSELLALLGKLEAGGFSATHELPVDPRHLTLAGARSLDRRVGALDQELTAGTTPLARQAGCPCTVVSSLSAAITLADDNVSAISPVVTLLSDIGIAIALAVAAAAGAFAVRRRQTEAALLVARGEHVATFSARAGLEAFLPVLLGGLAGFALAVALTGLFAPNGTVDAATFRSAAARTAVVVALALCLIAVAAGASFARLHDASGGGRSRLRLVPWELAALALGAYLLVDVRGGGGLASSGASGTKHPTLVVFVFPLLLAAGLMGIVARLGRLGLRRGFQRARRLPTPAFLALRRLAAARGLLVALTVVLAVSFAAFFYAETVNASLVGSTLEKAYIGFGSDAEGQVGESATAPRSFRFPTTIVSYANGAASIGGVDGTQADVLTIDPKTLPAAIHWQAAWGPSPAGLIGALAATRPLPLPVIVTKSLPASIRTVWISGARYPVRVVGRVAAFPGMTSNPLVVVSAGALNAASHALRTANPLIGTAVSSIWAKGPPAAVVKALEAPGLDVSYVNSIDTFRKDPQVLLATRTYSYMRTVGLAAALIALAGLMLYLQARQHSQRIASALARRMGLSTRAEILSLSLELGAILLVSAAVGVGVAAAAAAPVVEHIDVLPQFPPAPITVIPVTVAVLLVAVLVVVAVAAAAVTCRSLPPDRRQRGATGCLSR